MNTYIQHTGFSIVFFSLVLIFMPEATANDVRSISRFSIQAMIDRNTEVVEETDTTVHGDDFPLVKDPEYARSIIEQLNGKHVFVTPASVFCRLWQGNWTLLNLIEIKSILFIYMCLYFLYIL